MASQIDPSLTPEPSGINVGKILIAKLRTALGFAKSEIEVLQLEIANLTSSIGTSLTNLQTQITSNANAIASNATAIAAKIAANTLNVFSAAQRAAIVDVAPASGTYTLNMSAGVSFNLGVLAANANLTASSLPGATQTQSGVIFVQQPSSGNFTLTFDTAIFQAAGGLSTLALSTVSTARDEIYYSAAKNGKITLSLGKAVAS